MDSRWFGIGLGVVRGTVRGFYPAILFTPLLLVLAVQIGVTTGLAADSVEDARIERGEDYTVNISEPPRETVTPQVLPDGRRSISLTPEPIRDRIREPIRAATIAFTETMVTQTMQVASAVSIWTYHNRGWISPAWAFWVLNAVTISVAGSVLKKGVSHLHRVRDR